MTEILTNLEEINETQDCCETWPKIAFAFGWFKFSDYPDMAAMPHIRIKDGSAIRVNHCPACGKYIRMVNMQVSRIKESIPLDANKNEKPAGGIDRGGVDKVEY